MKKDSCSDDLLIVPLGLLLVIRMIPPEVISESREKANALISRPKSYAAAIFIVVLVLQLLILSRIQSGLNSEYKKCRGLHKKTGLQFATKKV